MIIIKNKTRARNILVYVLFILLAACASRDLLFINPNVDFRAIRTVAVMPFKNLTSEKTGAERVRDVLVSRLLSTGEIYVIPYGEVARATLGAGVSDPASPSVEEIIKLSAIAKVDAVITGVVREYGEVRSGGAVANLVSFNLTLIESKSGRTAWEASSTKGGITLKDRLVGGYGQPLNNITDEAVTEIIDKYFQPSFIKDKGYANIPNPVLLLTKSGDVDKAEDSLDKEQQKPLERKEVEKPGNKTALIDAAVDSPLEDLRKEQELKDSKTEGKESLKEITEPRKELAPLKEKEDTQKIKPDSDTIDDSSDKDDKNLVQARPDTTIDTTNKFTNDITLDSQYASETIYTIQTGSFLKLEQAQKQFDSMLQIVNGKENSFLRIEKIGNYFSVRLGRFIDHSTAERFAALSDLSNAVILKAYIKEERIIRLDAASSSVPADSQYASESVYTIQTGSFLKLERAQIQFDSFMQTLDEKDNNYLRIEKIGEVYSVRVGRFSDYNAAKNFIQSRQPHFNRAIILKAFIKPDRIIRSQ